MNPTVDPVEENSVSEVSVDERADKRNALTNLRNDLKKKVLDKKKALAKNRAKSKAARAARKASRGS